MSDFQAKIKGDIEIIRSEISSLSAHTADLKGWIATHMIFAIPAAMLMGWALGKIL